MEDVDLVRRLGRRRLARIGGRCIASARRYRRDGYWRPAVAQPRLPFALFRRGPATPDLRGSTADAAHLVLFMRAPLLGSGQAPAGARDRRYRGAAFRAAMIALLLRRLAKDRRWRLRIAVTPDRVAVAPVIGAARIEAIGQGGGDLGIRMRRALATCPPGPVVLVGADIPALECPPHRRGLPPAREP